HPQPAGAQLLAHRDRERPGGPRARDLQPGHRLVHLHGGPGLHVRRPRRQPGPRHRRGRGRRDRRHPVRRTPRPPDPPTAASATPTAHGTSALTPLPNSPDTHRNPLAAPPAATFTIPVAYTAAVADYQPIEIFGQEGTQTLHFGSPTGPVTTDDDFGTINL